jgi:hypothetical protein
LFSLLSAEYAIYVEIFYNNSGREFAYTFHQSLQFDTECWCHIMLAFVKNSKHHLKGISEKIIQIYR